jgi:hypothetical protein
MFAPFLFKDQKAFRRDIEDFPFHLVIADTDRRRLAAIAMDRSPFRKISLKSLLRIACKNPEKMGKKTGHHVIPDPCLPPKDTPKIRRRLIDASFDLCRKIDIQANTNHHST